MKQLSRQIREQDIERLIRFVVSPYGGWSNWLVQGLPDVGIEDIFSELVEHLRDRQIRVGDIHLVETDFSSYWTEPVSKCLEAMLISLSINPSDLLDQAPEEDQLFDILLSALRARVSELAKDGHYLIFAFMHFDAILKFSQLDQMQHLLNVFQSFCYDRQYHTVNIVQCYRDIEEICQATNYSDYYKIFGSNHYRVIGVSHRILETSLKTLFSSMSVSQIQKIVELSGGYPEHVEVLLRFAGDVERKAIDKLALDALDLTFSKWEASLTPEEMFVLRAIGERQSLSFEHDTGKRKLQRKGIICENEGSYRITSPLFESFLSGRKGKVSNEQTVFIRRAGNLQPIHSELLRQLFPGYYYIEWDFMQSPRPGEATVYFVTGEDNMGTPFRPRIVKIDNTKNSEKELQQMDKAREMLGSLVPNIIKRQSFKGQDAIILEYATGDNRDYSVQQFADFYREHSGEEIDDLLRKVLGRALYPFYQEQKICNVQAKNLYFLPRVHQGEYDQIAKTVRRSRFYDSAMKELHLLESDIWLPNPGEYLRPPQGDAAPDLPYYQFFVKKYPVGLCLAHGDLNPRNFLVDGIGNIHLIDFSEMKEECARFLDFVRIEAEIKFKLAEITSKSLPTMIALEATLVDSCANNRLQRVKQLPLESYARKMVFAVTALRESARAICSRPISDLQFSFEYLLGLLAQTLRISLFQDYLDEIQQEFAVLSSALLVHKLEEIKNTLGEELKL